MELFYVSLMSVEGDKLYNYRFWPYQGGRRHKATTVKRARWLCIGARLEAIETQTPSKLRPVVLPSFHYLVSSVE